MRQTVLISLFSCSFAFGKVLFNETCAVQSTMGQGATTVCRREAGAEVKRFKRANETFYFIDADGCRGFVPGKCLRVAEATVPGARPDRPLPPGVNPEANREPASSSGKFFRVGPLLTAGAIFARPGENAQSSSGTDFGAGLNISFSLSRRFRASLVPMIEMMKLSRKVDGTGALSDPNPTSFEQSMTFVGGALLGGVKLKGSLVSGEVQDWWLDVGGEYLMPIAASQTDSVGNNLAFTSSDKLFSLILGPAGDFSLTRTMIASVYLHFLYNVGATGGSQLYGGRLRLALNFNL